MYWLKFILSAGVIIFAGVKLTRYVDQLSDRLQIGKMWIGIVLLGLITSLPEALTSLVSVISLQANDLAVGNLFGSNNFNPLLIVVMDMVYRKGSVTNDIVPNRSHYFAVLYASALSIIILAEIGMRESFSVALIGPLSGGSILIAVVYLIGMHHLKSLGGLEVNFTEAQEDHPLTLNQLWGRIGAASLFVILAAVTLARSADTIAFETGLGRTFVGSIFLAIVTSLPEMVVTLSAMKMGSFDLALGNIFGSNMTNLFIVFVCAFFSQGGPILQSVSSTHQVTIILSLILMGLAVGGISWKDKKTFFGMGVDTLAMLGVFLVGAFILYQLR